MLLNVLFEILLLAILIGGSYYGIKMGFIKIAAKPIKFIFALAVAFSLCKAVGTYIIAPIIQAPITNYIKEFMYANCATLSPENVVEEIPTILKLASAVFDVEIVAIKGDTTDELLEAIILNLTSPAVIVISIMIAFILLLLLSKLLFFAGVMAINSVFEIGVLAKINKVFGFVLAATLAVLAAWTFVGTVDFILHLSIFDGVEAIRTFDGWPLYRLFGSISPIKLLLSF